MLRTRMLVKTLVLSLTFGLIATVGYSQAQLSSMASRPASISWNPDPQALLVSYRDIWAEFANQDPTPLIRIFGDGRVLVHYPVYTPRAGQYELWLSSAELEDLLSLLVSGLASFEPKAVEREKQLEDLRRWEAALDDGRLPELFMVADDSTSVFEIHLTDHWPAGATLSSGSLDRTIAWLGVRSDAERYPDIEPVQRLRTVELALRALLERDDLWRIQ